MTQRLPETRCTLSSPQFTIEASNIGASLLSIVPAGYRNITRDVGTEIEHGRKAGLFCCCQVFGRLPERTLPFRGKHYVMPYPTDVNPEVTDPDKLFLHGLDYLYGFEVQHLEADMVEYVRTRQRLPENYPFPHRFRVRYSVDENGLLIHLIVDDVDRPTPVMLTIHPYFNWLYGEHQGQLKLQAQLSHRFDYPADSPLPMADAPPTKLDNGGPFTEMTTLPDNLDHSYISTDGIVQIAWGDGPTICMTDLTPESDSVVRPVHIWTTHGRSRNVCGVEHGGPSNVFALVENNHIPEDWCMVVNPGETRQRIVRYSLIS